MNIIELEKEDEKLFLEIFKIAHRYEPDAAKNLLDKKINVLEKKEKYFKEKLEAVKFNLSNNI